MLVWSPEVWPHHNARVDGHADPVADLDLLQEPRGDYGDDLSWYRRPTL